MNSTQGKKRPYLVILMALSMIHTVAGTTSDFEEFKKQYMPLQQAEPCPPLTFQCDTNECIPQTKRCDDVDDCRDASDEIYCEDYKNFKCPGNLFTCDNKECVKSEAMCDGYNQCSDASDEKACPPLFPASRAKSSKDANYKYERGASLMNEDDGKNKNGVSDFGVKQESNTLLTSTVMTSSPHPKQKLSDNPQSNSNPNPTIRRLLQDRQSDSKSNPKKPPNSKKNKKKKTTKRKIKNKQFHYEEFRASEEYDREMDDYKFDCPKPLFQCIQDDQCILPTVVCDGNKDCRDGTDELYCEGKTPADFTANLTKEEWDQIKEIEEDRILTEKLRARAKPMGPRYHIHPTDPTPPPPRHACATGLFKCEDGQCISSSSRCDGEVNCPDGSDETDCDSFPPRSDHFRRKRRSTHEEPESGFRCPDYLFTCKNEECVAMRRRCDGTPDCGDGSDEVGCHLPAAERQSDEF